MSQTAFSGPVKSDNGFIGTIVDANSNEQVKFTTTASAVNEITVTNAATGNAPDVSATGGDTNISLQIGAKGTGVVKVGDTGTATATAGAATLSKQKGVVTSEALTTAAGATYTLTLTNTKMTASSVVMMSLQNGTNTQGVLNPVSVTPGSGSCVFVVRNDHASQALNGTIKIAFFIAG